MEDNLHENSSDKKVEEAVTDDSNENLIKQTPFIFQKLSNTKHFPLLLTIFLLILVFISSFLLAYQTKKTNQFPTPTPIISQTSEENMQNWKTFSNNEYQIKYPADWYLGPFTPEGNLSESAKETGQLIISNYYIPDDPTRFVTGDGIQIEIFPEEYSESIGEDFDKLTNMYNKIFMATPNVTSTPDAIINLNGINATKRVKTVVNEEQQITITYHYLFIDRGSKAYIIAYMINDKNKDEEKNVNQILSTFKFLE